MSLLSARPLEATETLENAAEGEKDARVLSDLSAAYLERAKEERDAHFLMQAITASARALRMNPELIEALFNRALILEAAGLHRSARQAWHQYLKRDPYSSWAEEARSHWWRLSRPSLQARWKSEKLKLTDAALTGRVQLVRSIVVAFPGYARLYAEEELLGDWADAKLAKREAQASQMLDILRSIGAELTAIGGDRLVQHTVAEIEQAEEGGERSKVHNLAEGLALYRKGLERFKYDDFDAASKLLDQSFIKLHSANSKFLSWPLLYLAICDYYKSDYNNSLRRLRLLHSTVDSNRYPALAGRTWWIEGLVHYSRSDVLDALSAHISSLRLFRSAREPIHEGYAHALVAADLTALGELQEAWKYRYRALSVLPEIYDLRRVYSILQEAAWGALEEQRLEAALSLFDELLLHMSSREPGVPVGAVAEARARRAVILSKIGQSKLAFTDIKGARQLLVRITDGTFRRRVSADIDVAEADVELLEDPRRSVSLLSSALNFYSESGYRMETAEVLARRAAAYLAFGNLDAAKLDLDNGIWEYERQRSSIRDDLETAHYFNQVQKLFDRRIEIELKPPVNVGRAFAYAERARLHYPSMHTNLLEGWGVDKKGGSVLAKIQGLIPPGTVLIEYLVLPEQLLVWGFGREVVFSSVAISHETLAKLVEVCRQKMLSGHDARGELARLYDLLISPVESLLESHISSLIIVPDKFLQGLPLAALLNPRTGRFLVERFSTSVASSCYQFLSHSPLDRERFAVSGDRGVLIVDASQVASRLSLVLPSLPAAGEEVRAIASLYPKSLVLKGTSATTTRFLEDAPDYEVVHFSGHALSEPNPVVSALVLMPARGDDGVLYLRELSNLRLRKTRIVVLGACRTAVGSPPRDGGINLAQAFLRAGASAVVASLWNVSDKSASQILRDFHEHLVLGYRASDSLRLAQVKLLKSTNNRTRMPSAWAGFVVIGGDVSLAQTDLSL